MKQYPSISAEIQKDTQVWAFDKLDGSNIRAEWSPKKNFYKFGSRNVLLGEDHPILGKAINLIKAKAPDLDEIFRRQRWEQVVCFFEFYGGNSFAGQHDPNDQHQVTLFDVDVYKQGLLPPGEFFKLFENQGIAQLLYRGRVNSTLIEEVRSGTLPGMTFEGIVCKGTPERRYQPPVMFKIKNLAWYQKLKQFCAGDETRYQQLA